MVVSSDDSHTNLGLDEPQAVLLGTPGYSARVQAGIGEDFRDEGFRTTRWTLVRRAGGRQDEGARSALAQLCEAYWPPIYHYVRRRGYSEADARDHTQAFFTSLIQAGSIGGVRHEGGRFRAWLLGCLKHFLANESARQRAQKRGGGQLPLRLDFELTEKQIPAPAGASPEAAFERSWALQLLEKSLLALEGEYRRAGKAALFEALRPQLQAGAQPPSFRELAEQFGQTPGALKTAAHRLRRRYGELLRSEVRETLDEQGDLEQELSDLLQALRRP